MKILNLISKDNYTIKVQDQEQVKVQTKAIEAYVIIKSLKEKNTEYHTYRKKKTRETLQNNITKHASFGWDRKFKEKQKVMSHSTQTLQTCDKE